MTWTLAAVVLLAVATTGCATRGSVRKLQSEVDVLRTEVASLQRSHQQVAGEAARTLAEVGTLDGSVRQFQARLTDTAVELERLRTRLGAVEDDIKTVRTELTARPVPVAIPAPVPERPAREIVARPGAADAAYNAALATFRAREHGQAVLEFLDFIAKYPKHPLAANAQYWIGEAYYVQRDYPQAVLEFQKVLEYRNLNSKAPDALFKIGLCYQNLREVSRAQQTWQRLIREHPDSPAAVQARTLLRARQTSPRR